MKSILQFTGALSLCLLAGSGIGYAFVRSQGGGIGITEPVPVASPTPSVRAAADRSLSFAGGGSLTLPDGISALAAEPETKYSQVSNVAYDMLSVGAAAARPSGITFTVFSQADPGKRPQLIQAVAKYARVRSPKGEPMLADGERKAQYGDVVCLERLEPTRYLSLCRTDVAPADAYLAMAAALSFTSFQADADVPSASPLLNNPS